MTNSEACCVCPVCGFDRSLIWGAPPRASPLRFVAETCPRCGFAYGGDGSGDVEGEALWRVFAEIVGPAMSAMGLPGDRSGLLRYVMIALAADPSPPREAARGPHFEAFLMAYADRRLAAGEPLPDHQPFRARYFALRLAAERPRVSPLRSP